MRSCCISKCEKGNKQCNFIPPQTLIQQLYLAIKDTPTVRECGPHAHCADRTPHSMSRKVRTNTISALKKPPFFHQKKTIFEKNFFSEQTFLDTYIRLATTFIIIIFFPQKKNDDKSLSSLWMQKNFFFLYCSKQGIQNSTF